VQLWSTCFTFECKSMEAAMDTLTIQHFTFRTQEITAMTINHLLPAEFVVTVFIAVIAILVVVHFLF
jgi:hypothetical protein